MKTKVCSTCGHVGKPVRQCFESFLVDALAWLIGFNIALVTGVLPLLVLPLAWTLYHIARFRDTKCPQCGDLSMVEMHSTTGKNILARGQL